MYQSSAMNLALAKIWLFSNRVKIRLWPNDGWISSEFVKCGRNDDIGIFQISISKNLPDVATLSVYFLHTVLSCTLRDFASLQVPYEH